MEHPGHSLNRMYELARYYDIVFERDVAPQAAFCIDAFERFAGRAPESVLELACGPGYHVREFARRGLRAYGLDLSEGMIAYADQRARQNGLSLQFIQGDMRSFALDEPVDLVISLFDSVDFLLDHAALISHFRAVAGCLTPGGLYVVQQTPSARANSVYNPGTFHYHGERDGVTVDFTWGANDPVADVATGIMQVEMRLHVVENGQEQRYVDQSTERVCLPTELILAAEHVTGELKHVGSYGDFDLSRPPDWLENTPHLVTVFQRPSA